eukprot:Sdes_comp20981_c0_seq1m19300
MKYNPLAENVSVTGPSDGDFIHEGTKINHSPRKRNTDKDNEEDDEDDKNDDQKSREKQGQEKQPVNPQSIDRSAWLKTSGMANPAPGSYEQPDYLAELLKTHKTYGFKATGRELEKTVGYADKDFITDPGMYNVIKDQILTKKTSAVFRSTVPRIFTLEKMNDTPGVGQYELTTFAVPWNDASVKKKRKWNAKLMKWKLQSPEKPLSNDEKLQKQNIEKELKKNCTSSFKSESKRCEQTREQRKMNNLGPGIYTKNSRAEPELNRKYGIFYPV